jgi:hypothetical protein
MSNQRPSFAKRDREMKLKDKARAKAERRAAKRVAKTTTKVAPAVGEGTNNDVSPPATPSVATEHPLWGGAHRRSRPD